MKVEIDLTGIEDADPEFYQRMSGLKVIKIAFDVETRSGFLLVVPEGDQHMDSDRSALMYLLSDYMSRWLLDHDAPVHMPGDKGRYN